ncbi:hypothetical protein [Chryseobacterium sp. POE27]|uniref:hypothetical protein n=1 Tax=Chryseobacterium sp. POE27 TaxID=3138177 RepID=UPI00321B1F9F
MKVKTAVLSRHAFHYMVRALLLVLCFNGMAVKAQALSQEHPDIYVSTGTFIFSEDSKSFIKGKTSKAGLSKHKTKNRSTQKKKSKEHKDHLQKKHQETVSHLSITGQRSRHNWSVSGSSRWMGVLCDSRIPGYGVAAGFFYEAVFLLLAIIRLLLFFYSSFSLNKICILFCCRPPPVFTSGAGRRRFAEMG